MWSHYVTENINHKLHYAALTVFYLVTVSKLDISIVITSNGFYLYFSFVSNCILNNDYFQNTIYQSKCDEGLFLNIARESVKTNALFYFFFR